MNALIKHMQVGDVMTRAVISVLPMTSFKEIVELIDSRHVSAVPVVDDERRVLGVVSDAGTLAGEVPRLSDARILASLVLDVDGVVSVINALEYRIDDSKPAPVVEPPAGMVGGRLG